MAVSPERIKRNKRSYAGYLGRLAKQEPQDPEKGEGDNGDSGDDGGEKWGWRFCAGPPAIASIGQATSGRPARVRSSTFCAPVFCARKRRRRPRQKRLPRTRLRPLQPTRRPTDDERACAGVAAGGQSDHLVGGQ